MPKIAEVKEIDGQLWVRADISSMENGSAWWSPDEQQREHKQSYTMGFMDCKAGEPFNP